MISRMDSRISRENFPENEEKHHVTMKLSNVKDVKKFEDFLVEDST